MGDVWNIHDLWLMYSLYVTNGRCTEHPCFMVDVQDMSAPQKMVRTPMTEFRQPLQVQSHLEVPRILVQLGHIQRT